MYYFLEHKKEYKRTSVFLAENLGDCSFRVLMRKRPAYVQQSALFFSLFNCRVLNANIACLAVNQVFVEEHQAVFVRPIVFFQVEACTKHLIAVGFASKENNKRALPRRARSCGCASAGLLQFDSALVSFEP